MKRIYLIISLLSVVLILTGCSYERFKDRAVNYLKDGGYSCNKEEVTLKDGTKENAFRCYKEDEADKTFTILYENDFFVSLEVKKDDVSFVIREDTITEGYDIAFYKGDVSYGSVYTYVKGSIDSHTNESYAYGAEVIEECNGDLVNDNPDIKIKCDEVRYHLNLVNSSIKEFRDLYVDNDIPIRVELKREY